VTETPNPNIVDTDSLTGEMHPIRRCVISIGSNLGERLNHLQGALDALADTPEVWVTAVSPVYETAPIGTPDGAGDFLNAVVLADTTLSARTLLERALAIEDAYGRERTGEAGAPRTLDVDLVVVGERRSDDADLVLPHPRAHERAFVLAPWHDVEPDAELLDHGPVAELLAKAAEQGVRLREDLALELH
jgi:2-amino-4-hydroxy-6-hydroxymethyldihydropteridine diphosphokinase